MFVAWRLYGSLPQSKRVADETLTPGQRFAARDRELDRATNGPMWLKDSRVAQAVVDTLYLGQHTWKLYDLLAWVLMSNHVHILIKPHTHIAAITRAIKKHSARMANQILQQSGSPFWQDESYDHWVRDSAELRRITRYIEWNPVRAGLVSMPESWPWSSAGQVGNLPHVHLTAP